MRFWDSSAIVPLLVHEPQSARADELLDADPAMVVWWGAPVECGSAIARQLRDQALDTSGVQAASARLRKLGASWIEVPPGDELRNTAMRMLRIHPLRAADALHLSAAFIAAGSAPETLEFVTFDSRLAHAATLEGFRVLV